MSKSNFKSLQALCIESIVKDFDKFCASFSSTDPAVPLHHFEFLQRIYSSTILKKLTKVNILKDDHLKLILNKHLKDVDLEDFEKCKWEKVEERLLIIGDSIIRLTMTSETPAGTIKKVVQHSPQLQTLVLAYTLCDDDTLKTIGEACPLLKVLDITGCKKITTEGLQKLFTLDVNNITPKLTLHTLKGLHVEDEGIEFVLRHMPSLEVIQHCHVPKILYDMHKKDFKENTLTKVKKYNLISLEFYDYHYHNYDILLACTILCPRLKSLTHFGTTEEDVKLFSKFPQVENIKLVGKVISVSKASLISLNGLFQTMGAQLRCLDVCNVNFSASVLAEFCPRLRTLTLENVPFQNLKEWNISPMYLLKSFSFFGAVFTEEAMRKSIVSILNSSPNLEILKLPDCQPFEQEIQDAILNCRDSLKEIHLCTSDVKLPFLQSILPSSVLEILDIEGCEHISSEEYDTLLDMVRSMNSSIDIIWFDSGTDYMDDDDDDDDIEDEYEEFMEVCEHMYNEGEICKIF